MYCKNCAKYEGNCGNHFIDWNGHINYDISNEAFDGSCFIPSEEYKEELKENIAKEIVDNYSIESIKRALAILETETEEKT